MLFNLYLKFWPIIICIKFNIFCNKLAYVIINKVYLI